MKKLLLPLLGLVPLLSLAGGFQVNLQGTKQTGMGHLGSSFYLGASSAYFNPAMMGLDTNTYNFELGASAIFANVIYQNQTTGVSERTDNPLGTPFYFYGTYKINDKFSVGLAVFTPFGSSVDWGKNWSGNELIQDIRLTAINIQPTVSYNIDDKLSVGAGFNIVRGDVELNRNIGGSIGNDNVVRLTGDAIAMGFNAGAYYQATEKLSVGVTYKSQIDVELEGGDADFTAHPVVAANGVADTEFDATLPLPAMTTIGLAYQLKEDWLLSVEVNYVQWDAYESLDFDFKVNSAILEDSKNARSYENASIYRIGAQYSICDNVDLRAGFYYDESPVQDEFFSPETPNSDNLGLTSGFSYRSNNFTFDGSFLYINGLERESTYPVGTGGTFGGKYASETIAVGIGFNYNF